VAAEHHRHTALPGPQKQAPGRGQIKRLVPAVDFAPHRGNGRAGRSFLKHPKGVFQAARKHGHDPLGIKAELHKARSVHAPGFTQCPRCCHPQKGAGSQGQDPLQQRHGKAADSARISALSPCHLVQSPKTQPALRKQTVQIRHIEDQTRGLILFCSFGIPLQVTVRAGVRATVRAYVRGTGRPRLPGGGSGGRTKLRAGGEATFQLRHTAAQFGKTGSRPGLPFRGAIPARCGLMGILPGRPFGRSAVHGGSNQGI